MNQETILQQTNDRRFGRPRLTPESASQMPKAYDALDDKDAGALVDLLEEAGGNLNLLLAWCPPEVGDKQQVIAKILCILSEVGNEEHYQKWQRLLRCYKLAQHAVEESKALVTLAAMPKPTAKTPISVWLQFAQYWMTDIKEETKYRGRAQASKGPESVQPVTAGDPDIAKANAALQAAKEEMQDK